MPRLRLPTRRSRTDAEVPERDAEAASAEDAARLDRLLAPSEGGGSSPRPAPERDDRERDRVLEPADDRDDLSPG